MFWNAGGFGYVKVLIKLGPKIKYGWYVTMSTKKLLKWEKTKNIIFHSKLILSTFL